MCAQKHLVCTCMCVRSFQCLCAQYCVGVTQEWQVSDANGDQLFVLVDSSEQSAAGWVMRCAVSLIYTMLARMLPCDMLAAL